MFASGSDLFADVHAFLTEGGVIDSVGRGGRPVQAPLNAKELAGVMEEVDEDAAVAVLVAVTSRTLGWPPHRVRSKRGIPATRRAAGIRRTPISPAGQGIVMFRSSCSLVTLHTIESMTDATSRDEGPDETDGAESPAGPRRSILRRRILEHEGTRRVTRVLYALIFTVLAGILGILSFFGISATSGDRSSTSATSPQMSSSPTAVAPSTPAISFSGRVIVRDDEVVDLDSTPPKVLRLNSPGAEQGDILVQWEMERYGGLAIFGTTQSASYPINEPVSFSVCRRIVEQSRSVIASALRIGDGYCIATKGSIVYLEVAQASVQTMLAITRWPLSSA